MRGETMNVKDVYTQLRKLPNIDIWPEIETLLADHDELVRLDWRLPTYSLQALGNDSFDPLPLVSALACLQISIILVDDILDHDPRGKHHEMGVGRTANLSLALQAAAHLLVQQLPLTGSTRNEISSSLQRMAYLTSVGQEIDVQDIVDETSYWNLVKAKSTPFYAAALESGAIAGKASDAACAAIYQFGALFGEIIQIMDDITDAFEVPPKPDWERQNNNLIILYAKTADHPEQAAFLDALMKFREPSALKLAQSLLVSSGALSYGVFHIADKFQQAKAIICEASIHDSDVLIKLLKQQIRPVVSMIEKFGLQAPAEFL